MEPRFVEKTPIKVVGILTFGQPDKLDYNDIWAVQYMKYDEQLKPYSPDKGYYGVWLGEEGKLAYLAGMVVENLPEVPEGLAMREIPAARYAVFECTIGTLSKTYTAIWQEWLPTSNYILDESKSDFEYYPPKTGPGDPPAAIYIPIKVKEPQAT